MENSYYYQENPNSGYISLDAIASGTGGANLVSWTVTNNQKTGYHPLLAFKFIKSKFGLLERTVLNRRLERLEKAFYNAVENGQDFLANKFLKELSKESRESTLYAKGIRHFVERADIARVKNKIKDGHISDTRLEDYTKVIPKHALSKKKEYQEFFDGFIIYHYYNQEIEEKISKKQKRTEEEKQKMKDPILFGWIKECDRLYFIDDWEDEYCDLTFDEIIDVVGENKLSKYPALTTQH